MEDDTPLFAVDVHLELILPFIVSFISFKQSRLFSL